MISSRLFLAPIFAMLLASAVAAQGTGQSLCSGGTRDGGNCLTDTDCNGSGVCVVTQGICDGGGDTGLDCDCPAAACVIAPACVDDPTAGTCSGGPYQGQCCDTLFNCADAAPCRGTQKICNAGEFKGLACLRDADCPGGACTSSGKLCASDRYPCFDDSDCVNVNDTCVGPGFITPTASPTAIGSTPTPTPTVTPGGPACVGDCGGSGDVTVDELLRLVNIALDNIADNW